MQTSAVLAMIFLLAGCDLISPKPKVSYPVPSDTEALSFVDYPSPLSTMNTCPDPSHYSNIPCPFTRRLTVSFKDSFIEEERCSCFPEITRQRAPLDDADRVAYLRQAQTIHTLADERLSCISDTNHTALIIQSPSGEQRFFITKSGWKACGSQAAYVHEASASDLIQNLGHEVAATTPATERALRRIYNEHQGFAIAFPVLTGGSTACLWQRSYAYKAEARSMEVSRCDGDRGQGSRTIQFDEAENERLLTALRALEAPNVEASLSSCKAPSAIVFELYERDGTPDPFEFDGPICGTRGTVQPVDFRRFIFAPSAAGFIDLLEAYDNF